MQTTIDRAGRIVIPKSIRSSLGMLDGATVEIHESDGRIVIEAASVAKHLETHNGVVVCVPDTEMPTLTAGEVRDVLDSIRR